MVSPIGISRLDLSPALQSHLSNCLFSLSSCVANQSLELNTSRADLLIIPQLSPNSFLPQSSPSPLMPTAFLLVAWVKNLDCSLLSHPRPWIPFNVDCLWLAPLCFGRSSSPAHFPHPVHQHVLLAYPSVNSMTSTIAYSLYSSLFGLSHCDVPPGLLRYSLKCSLSFISGPYTLFSAQQAGWSC